jgi:dimethylaniline monooxygenase (N-oxide forming)
MNIAIVGAGVTGLVTAKVLMAHGHSVTVFEHRPELGGVWETSRRYVGLKLQSPRAVYTFSDFDMPHDYPDFPAAAQIAGYLDAYAEKHGLKTRIRFGTRVAALQRSDRGWRLELQKAAGGETLPAEAFDHVVLCNGLFTSQNLPVIPGREAFESAGGRVVHSAQFTNADLAANKDVVVVGFGKSALDAAYEARKVARRVTLVFRRTVWHVPHKMFGLIPSKKFAYSRATEFWHGRRTTGAEGFFHRRMKWLVQLYWAGSELVIGWHTGLLSRRMRPPLPLRPSIGLATGFGSADHFRAVRDGRIAPVKGAINALSAEGVTLESGERIPAQLLILATGFKQELSILSDEDRAKVVTPRGDYRLYRNIVAPDLPNLSFNGYNGTTAVPVTSEIAAHWIARWLGGRITLPDVHVMNAAIDDDLAFRRAYMRGSEHFGHFSAPFSYSYRDALLADMGLPPADAKHPAWSRFNAILNPRDYAILNAAT